MSSRGYNETLMVPSNIREGGSSVSFKTFDAHIRTLNNGLLSIARNLSGMHNKVTEVENKVKTNDELLSKVEALEKTIAVLCAKVNGSTLTSLSEPAKNTKQKTQPAKPQPVQQLKIVKEVPSVPTVTPETPVTPVVNHIPETEPVTAPVTPATEPVTAPVTPATEPVTTHHTEPVVSVSSVSKGVDSLFLPKTTENRSPELDTPDIDEQPAKQPENSDVSDMEISDSDDDTTKSSKPKDNDVDDSSSDSADESTPKKSAPKATKGRTVKSKVTPQQSDDTTALSDEQTPTAPAAVAKKPIAKKIVLKKAPPARR